MKIEVNIQKSYAFVIIGLLIIIGVIGIGYAYNADHIGGVPSDFGHSADEIEINIPGQANPVTLNYAIENGLIGGSGGPAPTSGDYSFEVSTASAHFTWNTGKATKSEVSGTAGIVKAKACLFPGATDDCSGNPFYGQGAGIVMVCDSPDWYVLNCGVAQSGQQIYNPSTDTYNLFYSASGLIRSDGKACIASYVGNNQQRDMESLITCYHRV